MKQYRYLIIGGGMTAAAATKGIREVDATGPIGLLGAETHRPYARPPLSKKLWRGETTPEKIMRKIPDDIDLHLGRTAQTLDLAAKQVTDDQGEVYRYEKLLLATGGTPRRLPFGGDNSGYDKSPMFYSDLFELGYEAVGEVDSRLQMVIDWQEPYHKGVLYYLKDGRVRGVLLWNVWGQVDAARELIAAGQPVSPELLAGRLK